MKRSERHENGASSTPYPTTAESFQAKILDSLYDGVYFVDRNRRITYWNQAAERVTGYSSQEAVGSFCFDNLLSHVDGMGCQLCTSRCPLVAAIEQDRLLEDDVYLRHKEGHRLPVSVRVAPIKDDEGRIVGAVEVFSDASRLRATERRVGELESIAFLDPLTSLPNRRYMTLRVQQALEEAKQFGRHFALLFVDIDRFKVINDTWGHSIGDTVLNVVATTLSHNLRSPDIAGRWGGDEFLAVVSDITVNNLLELCERCRHLIARCAVGAKDERVRITVSIGATMLRPGETADDAINRADQLMYRSKSTRNQTTVA